MCSLVRDGDCSIARRPTCRRPAGVAPGSPHDPSEQRCDTRATLGERYSEVDRDVEVAERHRLTSAITMDVVGSLLSLVIFLNQVQFSTRSPETRRNSFTLLVISTNPKERAWPAIIMS